MYLRTSSWMALSAIMGVLLFAGCNSDSTTASSSSGIQTGYIYDSAIEGLEYSTDTQKDLITGADGSFKYILGEKVTFKIGNVTLGQATDANTTLTLNDIAVEHNVDGSISDEVANMAILLQSLDTDRNASNGISISKDMRDKFKTIDKQKIDANSSISDLLTKAALVGIVVKDRKSAVEHFAATLEELQKKETVAGSDGKTVFKTSILHINDSHSNLDESTMVLKVENNQSYEVKVGGMPRVVGMINGLQKSMQNPITIHSGDALQGTMYYSMFKYKADAELLNLVKFDSLTIGNHEFDDGDTNLLGFINALTAKVISANVEVPANNPLYGKYSPYIIKEIGGEKVGIIGITIAGKTKDSSFPSKEVVFKEEIATAQKYINELKAKGINKIIVSSHIGYKNDLNLAKNLTGVDVIVGGDSHTLLGNFSTVGLKASGKYPTVMKNKSNESVCVVQASEYAKVVGALEVGFDKNGVVTECSGSPRLLVGDTIIKSISADGKTKTELNGSDKNAVVAKLAAIKNIAILQPDANAVATLKKYSDQVATLKATKIGEASEVLGHNRVPGDTYDKVNTLSLGSDIAPIVAKSFYDLSLKADACIQNGGGVRIAVPVGDVTYGTAYTLLPFANTLFEISMKGSEIKQVLEDALTSVYDKKSTGSFPYAYGLKFDIDSKASANSRVSNLEIKSRATGAWSTIENNKMYVVVTNSFTAAGQDGYTTFLTVQNERGVGTDTYLDYAMSFVKYMEALTKEGKKLTKLPIADHPIKSYK